MHNCKATRERVTEMLLSGTDPRPDELLECDECRQEIDALKETLRITTRMMETAAPAETYWSGYHARLKQKLTDVVPVTNLSNQQARTPAVPAGSSWLVRFFISSVRVPLPVGTALILVFAVSLVLAIRAVRKNPPIPPVSVVQVPVEVPVIQERVVTRVVYRQSHRQTGARSSSQRVDGSTLAKSQKVNPVSLIGFKPLDEVKLTVIKGGSPDEK